LIEHFKSVRPDVLIVNLYETEDFVGHL